MKVSIIGKYLHFETKKKSIWFGWLDFSINDRFLPVLYVHEKIAQ